MKVVLTFLLGTFAVLAACQSGRRAADTAKPDSQGDGAVELHNGANRFDLIGDGEPAQAFVAYRGNFNAHGFRTVAIYLWSASDADTAKQWLVVPRFGGPYDGDLGREIFETSEGADCTLGDLRLVQHAHAAAELVVARRALGESFADTATTHFDYYRLTRNTDGVPGWPLWYFQFVRSVTARRAYCDVNVAFDQELRLGRRGASPSEASR